MAHRLHNSLYAALEEIANAEKITRKRLAEMSRDLLVYVPETDDIDIVNRLVGVLTPMNSKVAIMYFKHFLPWEQEKDNDGNHVRFGKRMQGDKKVNKKLAAITEWLKDESNTIWTWAEDNVEVKQKDFAGQIKRAIAKALEGDEKSGTEPLSPEKVMESVLEGGITIEQLMDSAAQAEQARLEAEQEHMDQAA